MIIDEIRADLLANQDLKYRDFQAKLTPGVSVEKMIGVRTPVMRALAKKYAKRAEIGEFLAILPHEYYDEYNLHGFILSECKDYQKTIGYLDEFLPYVDNWATCDLLSPKCFKKNRKLLMGDIDRWLSSDKPFIIRFGIEMLMSHFLDEDFKAEYLEKVAPIRSEEYYVNMMIAWYFATALAKQWDSTIGYVTENRLDVWTHNKTIQKAVESYRITDEQKAFLRSLKR